MSVNLCTNGMLVEKYRRDIAGSGATCVTVSLDGATAACHDGIRGRAGSYNEIERGKSFLAQRANGTPILRVRMTVSDDNSREVRKFYADWRGVADDVLFQPVHQCGDAYYTGMQKASLSVDAAVISEQLQGTKLAKDPYMKQWVDSIEAGEGVPHAPCYAGVLMARIDPWGNVYPCLEQHVCVGSVRGSSFAAVWASWEGYDVYGYACVPPTPFRLKDWERYDVSRFVDPGCIPPEEGWHTLPPDPSGGRFATIRDELEILAGDRACDRAIFLFHTPPYRTVLDRGALDGVKIDHVPLDVHVGSIAVRRFIEARQPLLTLHRHVHESARLTGAWRERMGRTWALGAAHDGDELALVAFDPGDPEPATRELV